MKQADLIGKIQTVLGVIEADILGITMVHEHLLHDMTTYFVEPADASEKILAHQPVGIDNLWWVKLHENSNLDNLKLNDDQLAIKEATLYKEAGGNTIVELTPPGVFRRDPLGLVQISSATGLNIIMGAGYYAGATSNHEVAPKTAEELTDEIIRDIMVGVGDTGIRAGIIGEIHCSVSLEESERDFLRCCAAAQQQTGVSLSIHPSPSDDLVLEIIKILRDAGADLSHTIIGHVDVSGFNRNTCHKLADAGCYLAFDNFGLEGLLELPGLGRAVELKDTQRINDIMGLISDGYSNQIVVSQDLATKRRLASFGGLGYAHILRNIVPMMQAKGLSDEQKNKLLVENPKRALAFFSAKR